MVWKSSLAGFGVGKAHGSGGIRERWFGNGIQERISNILYALTFDAFFFYKYKGSIPVASLSNSSNSLVTKFETAIYNVGSLQVLIATVSPEA
jgi:hypothetical protein